MFSTVSECTTTEQGYHHFHAIHRDPYAKKKALIHSVSQGRIVRNRKLIIYCHTECMTMFCSADT